MSPVMEGDRPLANTKSGLWSLLGSAQRSPTTAHPLPLAGPRFSPAMTSIGSPAAPQEGGHHEHMESRRHERIARCIGLRL
jgi:hypothetical protein